jgi:hypothetical protein
VQPLLSNSVQTKAGEIIDDEVHDRLVKKVPAGARLNALMVRK